MPKIEMVNLLCGLLIVFTNNISCAKVVVDSSGQAYTKALGLELEKSTLSNIIIPAIKIGAHHAAYLTSLC